MNLVLILPRERELLLQRRFGEHVEGEAIMHALDSDVFYYLCAKTDWKTGRIGERSAISYARIAMALSEDIPRKHALRRVTRKCVLNSVQRLIKAKLLASVSVVTMEKKRLILDRLFWGALLRENDSSDNPDKQQLDQLLAQLSPTKEPNNSDLEKKSPSKSNDRFPPDGPYQYNYLSNSTTDQKFIMPLSWQADKKYVDHFLQASGFSGSQIKKIWFGKYVQYWSQQRNVFRTQHEWSAHFANHMQGYLLKPNHFEKLNGMLDESDHQTTSTPRFNSFKKAKKPRKAKANTKRLTVPMINDGSQLQAWAVTHGLPVATTGMDTTAYYRFLCRHTEKMMRVQERKENRLQ